MGIAQDEEGVPMLGKGASETISLRQRPLTEKENLQLYIVPKGKKEGETGS